MAPINILKIKYPNLTEDQLTVYIEEAKNDFTTLTNGREYDESRYSMLIVKMTTELINKSGSEGLKSFTASDTTEIYTDGYSKTIRTQLNQLWVIL